MTREIEISGCVSPVPDNMTLDDFIDLFIAFVESNDLCFGGGLREIVDGYYLDENGNKGRHVMDDLNE